MNKILIVYASKSGTTEKCAYKLANILKLVDVVNLSSSKNIDLDNYKTIIIGGNIRMGLLSKKVKRFIKDNKLKLLNKNTAYYICCGLVENKEQYFQNNFPKDILEKAIIYDTFGGEIVLDKCSSFDRMIMKAISSAKNKLSIEINQKSIERFAKVIKENLN